MRKCRYQKGSVKKQRGRWIGMWREDHGRKSRVIGLLKDMTKSEAREKVSSIIAEMEAKRQADRSWLFGDFVKDVYFPLLSPQMESVHAGEQHESGERTSR